MPFLKHRRPLVVAAIVNGLVAVALALAFGSADEAPAAGAPTPVMSVTLTAPHAAPLPLQVPATGNVMAWQEATIGAETEGLRLTEVHVNVGDGVVRGQVLATFNAALVRADVAEAHAAVAVAETEIREADGNAQRAKLLESSGAMSVQRISQYLAVAAVACACLDAARAAAQRQRVRLCMHACSRLPTASSPRAPRRSARWCRRARNCSA